MRRSQSGSTHVTTDGHIRRRRRRWRHLLSATLAVALSSPAMGMTGGSDGALHWQDKRYIENGFYDIAFNSEYERLKPVVRKWTQPLRIWFYSEAGDRTHQQWLLSTHFQQLSKITGLPITFVSGRDQANVRILFTSERDPNGMAAQALSRTGRQALRQSICLGQARFNRRAEIIRGTVVIPVERAESQGKLAPCVIEEVTQMLGLMNDSKRLHPTIFSDVTDDEFLTGLDYLLLKLLYSPALTSGMTHSQAAPIIRRQLDAWERQGLIQNAPSMVTANRLYQGLIAQTED